MRQHHSMRIVVGLIVPLILSGTVLGEDHVANKVKVNKKYRDKGYAFDSISKVAIYPLRARPSKVTSAADGWRWEPKAEAPLGNLPAEYSAQIAGELTRLDSTIATTLMDLPAGVMSDSALVARAADSFGVDVVIVATVDETQGERYTGVKLTSLFRPVGPPGLKPAIVKIRLTMYDARSCSRIWEVRTQSEHKKPRGTVTVDLYSDAVASATSVLPF